MLTPTQVEPEGCSLTASFFQKPLSTLGRKMRSLILKAAIRDPGGSFVSATKCISPSLPCEKSGWTRRRCRPLIVSFTAARADPAADGRRVAATSGAHGSPDPPLCLPAAANFAARSVLLEESRDLGIFQAWGGRPGGGEPSGQGPRARRAQAHGERVHTRGPRREPGAGRAGAEESKGLGARGLGPGAGRGASGPSRSFP